ncbi:MAG TPA: ABC transporter permease [Ktedonobacteraceae bacterium]|nr:ABC transporter permease [Ktedonobacteraceae bacterium]
MATPTGFQQPETITTEPTAKVSSWIARALYIFARDPRLWFGVVLLLFVIFAIFAPFISPYSPLLYHPAIVEQGPTLAHPLGTDDLGRDQLSRVIYGTRISLTVGVASILAGGLLGTVLGIIAAYFKGWIDQVVIMIIDTLLSFPSLILALAIVAALGPSIVNVLIALAIVRIPIYARLARGQTLQAANEGYVTAAIASGSRARKIMFRHILPNIFTPLLVQATISISLAILDESTLSFLGLGVQPPTPEWGSMISEAQVYLTSDPWMLFGPTLAIVLIVLSLNILGDALRDRLDPHSKDIRDLGAPLRE